MSDERPIDADEFRRLLSAIEETASQSANRSAIRQAVFKEFDEHDSVASEEPQPHDTVHLIELDKPAHVDGRRHRVRGFLLAAAALVLILGLAIGLTRRDGGEFVDTEAIDLPTPDQEPTPPTAPGVPLAPGPFELPSVGGGVSFDIPADLFLAEEQVDSVRLVTGDVDEPGAVTLLETELAPIDLARSIETMVLDENAVAEELTITGASGPVTRWRLRLPPTFFMPSDCATTQDCLTVPILLDLAAPPRLTQDSDTFVSIVEVDDQRILVIEQPGTATDPIAVAGRRIVSTLAGAR